MTTIYISSNYHMRHDFIINECACIQMWLNMVIGEDDFLNFMCAYSYMLVVIAVGCKGYLITDSRISMVYIYTVFTI